MSRMKPQALDTSGMTLQNMEQWGKDLLDLHKAMNWMIGDLAIAAKATLGEDGYSQAFPPDTSPGLIQRCEAVARAYRESDRNPLATWTIHMSHANKPNRIELVAASVDAGRTSDEERQHTKEVKDETNKPRWLLACDVNGYVNSHWHSGAGVEAAMQVSTWIVRLVERLKEKGLTDFAACFDAPNNHRKELTKDWEDKYKGNRGPKDPQLFQQIQLAETLLRGHGFACISVEGYEADDLLASFGKQFDGKVTIVSDDKDMRQCLSGKCNILRDVTWENDDHSGDFLPTYHWVTAKDHKEKGCQYCSAQVSGIPPEQWTEFQALAGDATDCVTGAVGIGPKIASDLLQTFGTIEGAIKAALLDDERIKPAKRKALIEFEPKVDITRQLVTLRTDLELPQTTRL